MSTGKSMGCGIAFFASLGFAVGLGVFLSIILLDDYDDIDSMFYAIMGIFIFLASGPIIAGFIGIIVGAASREKPSHAAGAGLVTGAAGFVIAALIIFLLMAAAIAIKFPGAGGGDEGDDDDDENEELPTDLVDFFGTLLKILLPVSVSGGLTAFISAKVFSGMGAGSTLGAGKGGKSREKDPGVPTDIVGPSDLMGPSQSLIQSPPAAAPAVPIGMPIGMPETSPGIAPPRENAEEYVSCPQCNTRIRTPLTRPAQIQCPSCGLKGTIN